MGKYPKARVVPFSSVVGSSVTLHDPETERVIGQLAILNTGGDTFDDRKARQIMFAEDTARRINAHDDLVAALKACVDRMGDDHPGSNAYWDAVRLGEAALAKAGAA